MLWVDPFRGFIRMVGVPRTQPLIAETLSDGGVRSSREIGEITGLPKSALRECLRRCWVAGLVLQSERPLYESERLNNGRAGRPRNTRPFHLSDQLPVLRLAVSPGELF